MLLFLYPRKHPDLGVVSDFDTVAAVAEAVGKYEIFGAVNACEIRLRSVFVSCQFVSPLHSRLNKGNSYLIMRQKFSHTHSNTNTRS